MVLPAESDVDVSAKRAFETDRREFGVFVSVMVALFGVFQALDALVERGTLEVGTLAFSWGGLLAFALPLGYLARFAWRAGHPLAAFGITAVGWRRALTESLVVAGPLIGLAIFAKWLFRACGWLEGDLLHGPFFTTHTLYEDALVFS
ncbi:MAG: hypothetical protein AAF602_32045, partial [Myxococcota bacterium]